MDCPRCKLVNPANAIRCDCGYDFQTGFQHTSLLDPRERERRTPPTLASAQRGNPSTQMLIGAGLCLLGLMVTGLTYGSASRGGGSYFVWHGAIVGGAIMFVRGFLRSRS